MDSESSPSVPNAQAPRTVEQVRHELWRTGTSITEWAKQHRVPRAAVYDLLRGKCSGRYGHSHRAAVLLGLKQGVIPKPAKTRTKAKSST